MEKYYYCCSCSCQRRFVRKGVAWNRYFKRKVTTSNFKSAKQEESSKHLEKTVVLHVANNLISICANKYVQGKVYCTIETCALNECLLFVNESISLLTWKIAHHQSQLSTCLIYACIHAYKAQTVGVALVVVALPKVKILFRHIRRIGEKE